jgi:hypothetical protein
VEVLTLLMFVGAVWVLGAVVLFAWNLLTAAHEHSDRLALLPLEDNWHDPEVTARSRCARAEEGKAQSR